MNGRTNEWVRGDGFLTMELNPALKIYGKLGDRYRIESRNAAGTGAWTPVATVTVTRFPEVWMDERADRTQARFYRAVKE